VENDAAVGVVLDNGETHRCKCVISACDFTQTITKFLRDTAITTDMQKVIEKITPSLSIFILYIGIDGPFDGLPPAGVNTWYLPHYDLDEIYAQMLSGNLNSAGMYMARVSPDHKTITAFTNVAYVSRTFWKNEKKKTAEDFLGRIQKFMPDLKKHIVYFDAATPDTLFRYTSNFQGAAYGWASTSSQMFIPELRQIPIRNLFLAGHWTSTGSGLPGALYSGFDAARRIIKKNKRM
jgi:prolycopene isomerase